MAFSEANSSVMDSGTGGIGRKCEEGEGTDSGGRVEETSPDMLRNTPSNIRRLASEIKQHEGHQKYLAQTRSPSDGGDVRWYFCKVPLAENELAASVPRTEVVGKGDYFRFGIRDSLAIEASFLQKEEELLSSWWKEYAECSEGPRQPSSSSMSDPHPKASSFEGDRSSELYAIEEERVGVPVKGGLYEVDLVKRHCFPVYWNGENRRVLRGHWFARQGGLDWVPVREDVAEQLEFAYRSQVWHRRRFQPSGLFAARVDLQGSSPGLYAHFIGEDDTWEAWLNVDNPSFVSLRGNGIKLRRGYAPSQSPKPTQDELRQQQEEEMDDYCSQVPVRHLVFMVHGIGQRLEKSNLVDDVGNFRHITAGLAEQHLTSYQRGTQRVLFIPCQWRKGLKLSGEAAVEKITLDGVRGLRVMLSATAHDILYYMSPIYCQDIINSVSNQLNRLYLKFLKRNPGYDGKVSLYGHSLGSVLSYDILCHQENLTSPFPMDLVHNEPTTNENCSVETNTQSSECNFSSNLEENLDGNNKFKCVVGPTVNPSRTFFEEGHVQDSCVAVGPPVPSDSESDEPSVIAMESMQQTEKPLIDEDVLESGIPSYERGSMNSEVLVGDAAEVAEEESECYEEKTIKSLREEIDSLKSRIKELESESSGKGKEEITTTCDQTSSEGPQPEQNEMPKNHRPCIQYTKLEFKVDTFFAVGSPLGVFLALRNIRIGIGKGEEYWDEENIREEMPACRKIFNIFHPFDPVAYRIEPLICKEYISKRPVIIPYHRGGKRLHIGFQEFTEDLASRSQAVMDRLHSVKVKVLTLCQSRNNDGLDEESENAPGREERSYGSIMMERLTGTEDGRVDHMLQDKTFQHPYLAAIGAHTNYWRDCDTALFILKHLFRDIPEEPNSLDSPVEGSSKKESGSEGWSDRREATDEELPLTFADTVLIRNFSRRAKRVMKRK